MRGPKPKPTEIRIREGYSNRQKLPEPILVSGQPAVGELAEPPAHLPLDAKEFWRDSVARLVAVGIIDRVDLPTLELLAVQFARARQAGRVIASEGHFALGAACQIRPHPALAIEREATAQFARLSELFGLNPVARARLGLAELHRRSLQAEFAESLGAPVLFSIEQ